MNLELGDVAVAAIVAIAAVSAIVAIAAVAAIVAVGAMLKRYWSGAVVAAAADHCLREHGPMHRLILLDQTRATPRAASSSPRFCLCHFFHCH